MRGHDRFHGSFCQNPVSNFSSARPAEEPRLPDTVWREIVVEHKVLEFITRQGLNLLLVRRGTQGYHWKYLSLAASKEPGAVGARQHAHLAIDGPHLCGSSAINSRFLADDQVAHVFLLEIMDNFPDFWLPLRKIQPELLHHFQNHGLSLLITLIFDGNLVGFLDSLLWQLSHPSREGLILLRRLKGFLALATTGFEGFLHV